MDKKSKTWITLAVLSLGVYQSAESFQFSNPLFNASQTMPAVKIFIANNTPQTIFSWQHSPHCNNPFVFPDNPVRAIVDVKNQLHVYSNNSHGYYQMVGRNFNSPLHVVCDPVITSRYIGTDQRPFQFQNHAWLVATWTHDGQNVAGLIHNEFHGQEFIAMQASQIHSTFSQQFCPIARNAWQITMCNYWNIVSAQSSDGGNHFDWVMSGNVPQLIAATPYRYNVKQYHVLQGMPGQTNIVQNTKDHFYYFLAQNNVRNGHPPGVCLFRNTDPQQPGQWLAWDGTKFSVAMNQNPYNQSSNFDATTHVCNNLPTLPHGIAVESLSYYLPAQQYILFAITKIWPTMNGRRSEAFIYFTSPDLIHWSQPALLTPVHWLDEWAKMRTIQGQSYPSLIDPSMGRFRRNFDQSRNNPYLYYTQLNPITPENRGRDRDLVRVPLKISL